MSLPRRKRGKCLSTRAFWASLDRYPDHLRENQNPSSSRDNASHASVDDSIFVSAEPNLPLEGSVQLAAWRAMCP